MIEKLETIAILQVKAEVQHIVYAIICNLRFNVPNKVSVVFHNGSNYDSHLIINELANEFEGQFECLGEKEKEVITVDDDVKESVATISYKIKFIDSARFMASSVWNLVHSLVEGIHKIKCKDGHCFLEYESVKDNSIKYKCLSLDKDHSNKLDKEFENTFKFSNNYVNKFILLLRKAVYL